MDTKTKRNKKAINIKERCNECGRSVKMGWGYINRVPDLNDVETRREMGKPFPKGDFICGDCDNEPKNIS